MPRITKAALAVLALQAVLTLVAVATDWRTCFEPGADRHPVSSAWVGHGSAISSPLNGFILLAAAALLALRFRRVSMVVAGVEAVLFCVGGVGEALSSPSVYSARVVLVASGLLGVAQTAVLLAAVASSWKRGHLHDPSLRAVQP